MTGKATGRRKAAFPRLGLPQPEIIIAAPRRLSSPPDHPSLPSRYSKSRSVCLFRSASLAAAPAASPAAALAAAPAASQAASLAAAQAAAPAAALAAAPAASQ